MMTPVPLIKDWVVGILGLLLTWNIGAAEGVNVSLTVSSKKISPDSSLSYRVTISAPHALDAIDIVFPQPWKDQGIDVMGPSVSQGTQMQIINGVMSSSHQYTYDYQISFRKPGVYTLKSPRVDVQGKSYRVEDVTVEVDTKYAQPQQQGQDPFGFFDRFFKGFDFGPSDAVRPPRKEDVQLVVQPSAIRVLEGEPIWTKMIAYIHRNYRPQNMSPHFDLPPKSLFWMEYLDQEPHVMSSVGPGQDVAHQLSEFVLFPLQAGTEIMDNISLEGDLVTGFQSYPFRADAKSLQIEVQPLPDPRPPLPLVSDELSVQFEIEKNQVAVDQPVKFSYVVSGVANLRLIDFLPVDVPPHVDVVTQEDMLSVVRRTGYRFELTKSGYVMARHPGHVTLKTQPLTYYNPLRRQYQKTESQTLEIEVVQSTEAPASVTGAPPPPLPQEVSDSTSRFSRVERLPTLAWVGILGSGVLLILVWGLWWTRRAAQRANLTANTAVNTTGTNPLVKK